MNTFLRVEGIVNLGQDPTVRYTPSGVAVANFSGASERSFKKNDNWETETEWSKFTAWNKTAENIGEYLRKGSSVYVEAYPKTEKWEKDGQDHYTTNYVIQKITFLANYGSDDGDYRSERGDKGNPGSSNTGSSNTGSSAGGTASRPDDDDIPF